jgi:hypothetical protein
VKLIYKPFALIASVIAAKVGRNIFKSLWAKVDQSDPPDPTHPSASLGKVVGAAALEAATMASIAAAADRAAARTFEYLTGVWPAKAPDKDKKKKKKKD